MAERVILKAPSQWRHLRRLWRSKSKWTGTVGHTLHTHTHANTPPPVSETLWFLKLRLIEYYPSKTTISKHSNPLVLPVPLAANQSGMGVCHRCSLLWSCCCTPPSRGWFPLEQTYLACITNPFNQANRALLFRLSPRAESVSSCCGSISEWVIAAEAPYQPRFLLGLELRSKKRVFLCGCCATICIYNPLCDAMKCSTMFSHGICNSRGEAGLISMFDGRQVWRSSQGDPSWRGERGPLHVECHGRLWGARAKSHAAARADGDSYKPVVNWPGWRGWNGHRFRVISSSLITRCAAWICDQPAERGGGGSDSGLQAESALNISS